MERMIRQLKRISVAAVVISIMLTSLRVFAASYTWPVPTSIGDNKGYPYNGTNFKKNHTGTDFPCSIGTNVYAAAAGTVTIVDRGCLGSHRTGSPMCSKGSSCRAVTETGSAQGSYGNYMIIDHGNNIKTYYCHLKTGSFEVSNGAHVEQGQLIAHTGVAGNTTGPHLHFEIRISGVPRNPLNYLTRENPNPVPPPVPPTRTENTAYSAYVPFSTYAISTGRVTVYDANGSAYSQSSHYIDGGSDVCVIQKVYTDGFCEVKYPSGSSASGYFTALAKLSDFISSPSLAAFTASSQFTAYRRSSGSDTIGSVFYGDACLKVAEANGRTQVIYPAGSSHKMGWIVKQSVVPDPPADESYKVPCKSYARSTGRISVYAQAGGSPEANRYIDGNTDLCTIEEIYTNGWCKVTYPTSSGNRTAYTPTSEFIQGSSKTAWSATQNMTAYRRSGGGDTIGSVDAGDRCVLVSEENGRLQLMYPVSGTNYYKMGWVDKPAMLPQGVLDSATGGMYTLKVQGWAFDRDNLNQALTIHIYAGSKMIGECIANKSRPDVNNAYPGVGNNHGFEATFDMTNYTGSQSITAYAINIGSGNSNPSLGTKIATISTDTTKPTISNISVSDIDRTGYTVTCTATDDAGVDRVQFPTWTIENGQDDLFPNWPENSGASGTKNGNTYTYRVHTSAHNGEAGEYVTHIYAYDVHGNSTCYSDIGVIRVPVPVVDVSLDYDSLSFNTLNGVQTLTAKIEPENATDKTLTWKSSDPSVATVSNGKVTAVNYGSAVITATSANGISCSCSVSVTWQSIEPDGILPAATEIIEESAFEGSGFSYVQLPETTKSIRSKAFAECKNLRFIYIPDSVSSIAADAFTGVNDLTIIGEDNSYAESYANRYGYDFVTR